MGHLGWTEREYYESSPEAFYYAVKGYFVKVRTQEKWARVIAYNTYRLAGGTVKDIDKYWPISETKKEAVKPVMDKEVFDSIMRNLKR